MPGPSSPAATLVGRFLVAAPSMPDERFQKSVVFICKHDDDGALEGGGGAHAVDSSEPERSRTWVAGNCDRQSSRSQCVDQRLGNLVIVLNQQ